MSNQLNWRIFTDLRRVKTRKYKPDLMKCDFMHLLNTWPSSNLQKAQGHKITLQTVPMRAKPQKCVLLLPCVEMEEAGEDTLPYSFKMTCKQMVEQSNWVKSKSCAVSAHPCALCDCFLIPEPWCWRVNYQHLCIDRSCYIAKMYKVVLNAKNLTHWGYFQHVVYKVEVIMERIPAAFPVCF